jgi:HlyD family secretion protein
MIEKQKTGKKIGISILIIGVFAIFVFIGWWNSTGKANDEKFSKNAISVQVDTVKQDKIVSTVKAKGTVEVTTKEALYVNNPVTVDDILVEVGDRVEKDQALIKYDLKAIDDLDQKLKQALVQLEIQELVLKNLTLPVADTDIEKAKSAVDQSEQGVKDAISNLRQTEVNYEQNKRSLEEAQKQYKSNQDLFEQGVLSKAELDRSYEQVQIAEDKLEVSSMQIQSAKRVIENAKQQKIIAEKSLNDLLNKEESASYQNQVQTQKKQIELQQLQIDNLRKQREQYIQNTKSPIKGTVLEIVAEKGTVANPGVPVIEIGDLDQLYIKVDINEFDSVNIKEGQEVKITSDALEQVTYSGIVQKVAPIAVTKQGTSGIESFVQVEIAFDRTETILKPGYSVEAEIITKYQEEATVIPILALIKDKDGTSIVYVMKEDYSVEKRKVRVGAFEDLYVEVEGVTEGEKVIINPGTQIKDGDYVKPIVKRQSGDSQ